MTDQARPSEEQDIIDDQMFDDDDCPNCDGSGWVDSCFEDTCVCIEPPCHRIRCDWCNHKGQRERPPVDRSHGEQLEPKPPGPLLEIMEKK